MRGLFVTGTDTDVGKSVVSCMLTLGFQAEYWKPIQSGMNGLSDSDFVASFAGQERVKRESYRLTEPLSPHHAAAIDGVTIDVETILSQKDEEKFTIVEGAGGLLVPLNDKAMMIDLISWLNLPCIVVARSGVGTLNHTLMTLEELKRRNVETLGVVLNGPPNKLNKQTIESLSSLPVLLELEPMDDMTKENLLAFFERFREVYDGRST